MSLVAEALSVPGGQTAMGIRLAEGYIKRFRSVLERCDVSVYPEELAGLAVVADLVKNTVARGGKS